MIKDNTLIKFFLLLHIPSYMSQQSKIRIKLIVLIDRPMVDCLSIDELFFLKFQF